MRDILFRGKAVNTGDWVYGSLLVFDEDNYYICVLSENGEFMDKIKVIPESVGQFTGMYATDKTKIFEGDLIYICLCNDESVSGEIVWSWNSGCWNISNTEINEAVWVFMSHCKFIQVENNIYDVEE